MPRLLIASTVPNFLRAFLLPYARHFRALGWQVDATANGIDKSEECVCAFDHAWDVRWERNPLSPSNILRAPRTLAGVVGQGDYDIVHVHTPVAGLVCRASLRDAGRSPVRIYTAHGFHFHEHGTAFGNAAFLALEKLAGRWTDYLVVINSDDEAAARSHQLVPPDRVIRMPGIGLDLDDEYRRLSPQEVSTVHEELALPPGSLVLAMVAEFIPRKRHQDALMALAGLKRKDVHLLLAGVGPTMPATRRLASELGLADRVHFLGFRRDIRRLVGASRALLLCSDQEGLPRSVMESMSLGVPVIGSDIRGTRELLQRGAGYLYDLGDTEQLSHRIAAVLIDPHEAASRARIARNRLQEYSLSTVIRLHEDLYSRALAEKHRRTAA